LPELGRNFLGAATAREMWLAIEATYSHKGDDARLFEVKERIRKCTQGTRSVQEYYSELQGLWGELKVCEKPCPSCIETGEKNKVFDFLMGLNSEYESVRSIVFAQLSLPPIGSVYYVVQREETRRKMMEMSVGGDEKMRMIAEIGPMKDRGRSSHQGGRGRGRTSIDRDKLKCSHCGRQRHTKDECWDIIGRPPHIGRGRKAFSATGEGAFQNIGVQEYMDLKRELDKLKAGLSRTQSGTSQTLHTQQGSQVSANLATSSGKWVIDTGATNHYSGMKHLFSNFHLHNQPNSMTIADGSSIPIIGKGSVSTFIATLNPVSFVPNLPINLLSVSALTKSLSCSVTFFSNRCIFQDLTTGSLLGTGYEENGLYILEDSTVKASSCGLGCFKSESLELFHYRLGHLHPKKLCILFPELPSTKEEFRCTVCVRAKQVRSQYPVVEKHSTTPFEIVHSDIWGPSPVTSIFGYKYYVCFVDDCSRYTTIFLIKSKSEVASIFLIYHKMIQTQYGATIKILRTDNGREYLSSDLQKYLELYGIRSQTSCPYTLQQNGVAERKNRHILEVTRSLLIGMNVPKYLWSEAMLSAVYLINRMTTDILNGKTPLQIVDPKSVLFHIPLCLPLKIRRIKKQLGTKDLKIQGLILKSPKRLNSSAEAPRKKEEFSEMLKNQNS
jgi:Integrase core domain/GAG-pre-integrase domain/gag-polypeptide of LTR copia-type